MRHNFKRHAGTGRFGRSWGHRGPGRLFRQKSELFGQPVYRSRRGMLLGVCKGIAGHFGLNLVWLRIIVFILFLFTGFWPAGVLYIIAAIIMNMEPASPIQDEQDKEFYQSYTQSRDSAIQRIKRKFDNIDRRIQRMEDTVTSKEFEL